VMGYAVFPSVVSSRGIYIGQIVVLLSRFLNSSYLHITSFVVQDYHENGLVVLKMDCDRRRLVYVDAALSFRKKGRE
jgi:hypothetical protein